MKKRLVTIFSLIMAFVLCFTLAACGGDNGGNSSNRKRPVQSGKAVSVSLNDALDAVDGVLNAEGFTGTASYTLSTENTQAITDSVALDKRGGKLSITAGADEYVVDFQTGYVYRNGENGYTYESVLYANAFDYAQYLLAGLRDQAATRKFDARYDAKAKTVTFTVERADDANKYIEPLQNAYKKDKNLGSLLNEYCMLFFGKSFDAMYTALENYIANEENTVGTLLDALKDNGMDVEAILEMFGFTLPTDQMNAIKARQLNQLVAGAYNYIIKNIGSLIPLEEDASGEDNSDDGSGMSSFGMDLLNAMLFEEVSEQEITEGLQGIKGLLDIMKTASVKTVIDMAFADDASADLYIVIGKGVKLKNVTTTLTLNVDDNKNIMGVKLDNLVAHTYKGAAAEDSILADNNYRMTAEIVIDEYTTAPTDFDMTFDPTCNYKTSIVSLIYDVTDKDVSVYYETGGKTVTVSSYYLCLQTPDGEISAITDVAEDAFKYDAATSSFVFDGALVQSVFSDEAFTAQVNAGRATFGTSVYAIVFFDDDEDGYAIALSYVNDDWQDIYDYVYETAMNKIFEFIGDGSGSTDSPATA